MKKLYFMFSFMVIAALLFAGTANAEDLSDVQAIVNKANLVAYYQGDDGRAKVKMVIKDSQDRTRKREVTLLRKDVVEGGDKDDTFMGDQKFYVYFHLPADVYKMVFMVWKHVGSDDDRWLYLPAMDLVKRIASTEKRTSFAGSDFFYEDVSGRGLDEDKHELVETTDTYYVVKNTPKKPEEVEFNYYKMWIHKDSFVTVNVKYYDEKDKVYREYKALAVDAIQNNPTVTKAKMIDHRKDSETVNTYKKVKYDIGIPDDIFTERYLRRTPVKYLR